MHRSMSEPEITNPAMVVALKLKDSTVWLKVAENALPTDHPAGVRITTSTDLIDLYGPMLHAIAIDKISRGEAKVDGRYLVTTDDF